MRSSASSVAKSLESGDDDACMLIYQSFLAVQLCRPGFQQASYVTVKAVGDAAEVYLLTRWTLCGWHTVRICVLH